jgi:hypothetical protein
MTGIGDITNAGMEIREYTDKPGGNPKNQWKKKSATEKKAPETRMMRAHGSIRGHESEQRPKKSIEL